MKCARLARWSTELLNTELFTSLCSRRGAVTSTLLIGLQRAPWYLAWSFSRLKFVGYLELLQRIEILPELYLEFLPCIYSVQTWSVNLSLMLDLLVHIKTPGPLANGRH